MPGKWPDDASDVSRSEIFMAEDGLHHDILVDATRTTFYFYILAVVTAISQALRYICFPVVAWIGIGTCSACGKSFLCGISR